MFEANGYDERMRWRKPGISIGSRVSAPLYCGAHRGEKWYTAAPGGGILRTYTVQGKESASASDIIIQEGLNIDAIVGFLVLSRELEVTGIHRGSNRILNLDHHCLVSGVAIKFPSQSPPSN